MVGNSKLCMCRYTVGCPPKIYLFLLIAFLLSPKGQVSGTNFVVIGHRLEASTNDITVFSFSFQMETREKTDL